MGHYGSVIECLLLGHGQDNLIVGSLGVKNFARWVALVCVGNLQNLRRVLEWRLETIPQQVRIDAAPVLGRSVIGKFGSQQELIVDAQPFVCLDQLIRFDPLAHRCVFQFTVIHELTRHAKIDKCCRDDAICFCTSRRVLDAKVRGAWLIVEYELVRVLQCRRIRSKAADAKVGDIVLQLDGYVKRALGNDNHRQLALL